MAVYQPGHLVGRFLRGFSQQESARLLEEALYNPSVAGDLAKAFYQKRTTPIIAKRLNTYLLTIGGKDGEERQSDSGPIDTSIPMLKTPGDSFSPDYGPQIDENIPMLSAGPQFDYGTVY